MWSWPDWLIASLTFKGQALQNPITFSRFPKQGRLERRAWILPMRCCLLSCGTRDKPTTPAASLSGAAGQPGRQGHSQAAKGNFEGSCPWGILSRWHGTGLH